MVEEEGGGAVSAFERFLDVVRKLISENGCPWDRVQTPYTLRKYMIEECFEAVDAITQGDSAHAKEELGDLLFNVFLDACLYERQGEFSVNECLDSISDKLIRRHPHVFSESEGRSESDADLGRQWEKIKRNVEGRKSESVLDDVPRGFPPLLRASKLLKKAENSGFRWKRIEDSAGKVAEEISEVDEAVKEGNRDHIEEECGDLLLALVNYTQMLGVDPNVALSRANEKFCGRFAFVEKSMRESGFEMDQKNLDRMEEFWAEAKKSAVP